MAHIAISSVAQGGLHTKFSGRYQYASLDDKSRKIRLLKIYHKCRWGDYTWDRQDQGERDLQAVNPRIPRLDLQEISLNDNPSYEAISYAWGSTASMQQVKCSSGVLQVTESCFQLLCRLRQRDLDGCTDQGCIAQARLYWIDAICINQDSELERGQQVAMMATIYEKAERVIVWPGHVEDESEITWALSTALQSVQPTALAPLQSFIEKPYFTRMWPLQEVALAQSCRILIGSSDVDIRSVLLLPHPELGNTIRGSYRSQLGDVYRRYKQVISPHQQLLAWFQSHTNVCNISQDQSRPPLISEVLLSARNLQASEPRDKVFALYGLLQRLHTSLEAPDYTKSVEEVYVEASVSAMATDNSPSIFRGLTGTSSFDLPSWSPDWSDHDHITEVTEWRCHRAGGSTSKAWINERELSVYGLIIDVACQEHITFPATCFLKKEDTLTKKLSEPLCTSTSITVNQYVSLLHRFCFGILQSEDKLSYVDVMYFEWLDKTIKAETKNQDSTEGKMKSVWSKVLDYQEGKGFTGKLLKDFHVLHAGLCRRLDRKKLFQTQHGRLGFASAEMKNGDSIILLQGCNLPMVARLDGIKWKLIAPAYLPEDSIMTGDLWETHQDLQLFTFV